MKKNHHINDYLNGSKLIGDDYEKQEILQWYEEEKNAYVDLTESREFYLYDYHALNNICGFFALQKIQSHSIRACAFGSAFGEELLPIMDKISSAILIDSATSFHEISYPANFQTVLANASGKINCNENSFDLITCFGVLHHIPNVSFVVSELYRCLDLGGVLLVREPVTSMGDWRLPRKGVTKNERGIPSPIFRQILLENGFEILRHTKCMFPPLALACRVIGISPYNSRFVVYADLILCRVFGSNYRYHRTKFFQKFSHASDFYVCRKK